MKYIGFQADSIQALATQLNDFVTAGGTIESVVISTDKIVCALIYGQEGSE